MSRAGLAALPSSEQQGLSPRDGFTLDLMKELVKTDPTRAGQLLSQLSDAARDIGSRIIRQSRTDEE